MSLERVIAVAEGEIGRKEDPPGSNRVPYWDDYDPAFQGQPWCLGFQYSCFKRAGEETAFMGGGKTASCGIFLRWHREMGQTVPVGQIRRGDIPILNFHGTQDTEHCGLVTDVVRSNGSILYFVTIEGNTGIDSQSNGGMVCRKTRYPRQVVGVCRPRYKAEPVLTDKPEDFAGHWAEADIRWCMERGILKGYEDGTFRPDRAVTRAELAAVLRRALDK